MGLLPGKTRSKWPFPRKKGGHLLAKCVKKRQKVDPLFLGVKTQNYVENRGGWRPGFFAGFGKSGSTFEPRFFRQNGKIRGKCQKMPDFRGSEGPF